MIRTVLLGGAVALVAVGAAVWFTGRRFQLDPAARAGRRILLLGALTGLAVAVVDRNGVWRTRGTLDGDSEANAGPGEPVPNATDLASSSPGPAPAGFWLVAADGTVAAHGGAPVLGSLPDRAVEAGSAGGAEIVALARTASGAGYWLVAADGKLTAFGDAAELPHPRPARPVIGAVAVPGGDGLWLLTEDGLVLGAGNTSTFGSPRGTPLAYPVVGLAATGSGRGYWITDTNGSVFSFGDAGRYEKLTSQLNKPMVGIDAVPAQPGYWLVAGDGGVFAYPDGRQPFYSSLGSRAPSAEVVGIAATSSGNGYWLADRNGTIYRFGDALALASTVPAGFGPAVGIVAAH